MHISILLKSHNDVLSQDNCFCCCFGQYYLPGSRKLLIFTLAADVVEYVGQDAHNHQYFHVVTVPVITQMYRELSEETRIMKAIPLNMCVLHVLPYTIEKGPQELEGPKISLLSEN